MYGILCRNVTIFYRQELSSSFKIQEKLKACRSLKLIFSSSCFIADDSRVKIVWLHVAVFSKHDILHLFKSIMQWKYIKTSLIPLITQIKPAYKFSNFRVH